MSSSSGSPSAVFGSPRERRRDSKSGGMPGAVDAEPEPDED